MSDNKSQTSYTTRRFTRPRDPGRTSRTPGRTRPGAAITEGRAAPPLDTHTPWGYTYLLTGRGTGRAAGKGSS